MAALFMTLTDRGVTYCFDLNGDPKNADEIYRRVAAPDGSRTTAAMRLASSVISSDGLVLKDRYGSTTKKYPRLTRWLYKIYRAVAAR